MTTNGRLAVIELKLRYIERMMYGVFVILAAQFGITII